MTQGLRQQHTFQVKEVYMMTTESTESEQIDYFNELASEITKKEVSLKTIPLSQLQLE